MQLKFPANTHSVRPDYLLAYIFDKHRTGRIKSPFLDHLEKYLIISGICSLSED